VSGDKIPEGHVGVVADCFTTHARGLFGYSCVLTCGDRTLADDLVQSAFMAAARRWSTMRCLGDVQRLRWLHTTVGNLAIGVFRRNGAFRDRLPRLEVLYRPPPADICTDALSGIALERCWQVIQALPP
jgi:DNA-directed RNA polymerase specialized sigma24 family protein